MSPHYIIDGYNALHSTGQWDDMPREAQREFFLKYLDQSGLTGSPRNSLTVVLDGYAAPLRKLRFNIVQLLFSGDRDADTAIKEHVAEMINPKEAVVVTNDRGIREAVRDLGARVMSCEDFFQRSKKKTPARKSDKPDALSSDAINRELKRLWKLE